MSRYWKGSKTEEGPRPFHCPVGDCLYAEGSERFFTDRRYLNQHIGKVHAEKKYSCSKCHKGFSMYWMCKKHEEHCGQYWHCSCGQKYTLRESLLTHARRAEHTLPEDQRAKSKKFTRKPAKPQADKPVVIIIQPVIQQQVSYILPPATNATDQKLILPKPPEVKPSKFVPILLSRNNNSNAFQTGSGLVANTDVGQSRASAGAQIPSLVASSKQQQSSHQHDCARPENASTRKAVAETQTCDDSFPAKSGRKRAFRRLESRGSQCSGHKSGQVKIKSTHTQTVESTVVKMKKRHSMNKSRRKSVAVITDVDLTQATQELWSDFENFLLQIDRYSASTQTSTSPNFSSLDRVSRDSQTVTESDLFPLGWNDSGTSLISDSYNLTGLIPSDQVQSTESLQLNTYSCTGVENSKEISSENPVDIAEAQLAPEFNADGSFSTSSSQNLDVGMFSSGFVTEPVEVSESRKNSQPEDSGKSFGTVESSSSNLVSNQNEFSALDLMLDDVIRGDQFPGSSDTPVLSHTQTQTNGLDTIFDSEFFDLANMETQTTEDLLFPDLEFSDTETQTAWDDIQPVADDLQVDQLSIEIQTDDVASLTTNGNCATSSISLQGVYRPLSFGSSGLNHIETQTLDSFAVPQLMHSEAQTYMHADY